MECFTLFGTPVCEIHKELERTRQALYVQCNNEASVCNHCYSGRAISIPYSECVPIA